MPPLHSSLARCHFLSAIFSFFKSCYTTCSLSNPPIFLAVVIFYELKLFVILIFLTVKKNNKKGGRVPFLNLTEEDNVAPDHLHERSHTTLIFNLINGQINIPPSRVISLDQSDIAAHSRQIYFFYRGVAAPNTTTFPSCCSSLDRNGDTPLFPH